MTANSAVVFVNETLVFLGATFRCAPNVLQKTPPYMAEYLTLQCRDELYVRL
jgi:hypothetical protein